MDKLTTEFLTAEFGAARQAIRHALRCEGFATPMYACDSTRVGFSSHSRSNSFHPGDKSGRRQSSRRSPDFCIRFPPAFRMLGEVKYVEAIKNTDRTRLIHEMKDYLSISSEPTSDWGHDFAFGLLYEYGGDAARVADLNLQLWESDRIVVSCLQRS